MPEPTPAGALASECSLLPSWSTWEGSASRYWSITQILLWISITAWCSFMHSASMWSLLLARSTSVRRQVLPPQKTQQVTGRPFAPGCGLLYSSMLVVPSFWHTYDRRSAGTHEQQPREPPCAGGELGVGLGDAVSWLPSPSKWAATQVVGEKNA